MNGHGTSNGGKGYPGPTRGEHLEKCELLVQFSSVQFNSGDANAVLSRSNYGYAVAAGILPSIARQTSNATNSTRSAAQSGAVIHSSCQSIDPERDMRPSRSAHPVPTTPAPTPTIRNTQGATDHFGRSRLDTSSFQRRSAAPANW